MKKKLRKMFLGVLCLMILFVGCSTKEEERQEEPQFVDETFVQDMSKGLQSRWDLNAADEKKEGYEDILVDSEEYKKMMLSYIDAELDMIEKYTEEKFEDKNLQEMAIKYVNLLKKHKEICDYMTVDYNKYDEEFQPIYDERSKIIESMVKDYGMTVDEKHQSTLDDFLTNSKLVKEDENVKAEINNMLGKMEFEKVEDDYGYKTYYAVVENTTSKDFNSLQISINLLDKEDVIVETTYDSVDNFAKGEKVRFEFSTDKEFEKTEVVADFWD